MKAFGNFDKVVASNGGSSMLEPGGYVAKLYVLRTTQTRQSHTLSSSMTSGMARLSHFFSQQILQTPPMTGDTLSASTSLRTTTTAYSVTRFHRSS